MKYKVQERQTFRTTHTIKWRDMRKKKKEKEGAHEKSKQPGRDGTIIILPIVVCISHCEYRRYVVSNSNNKR